MSAEPKRGWFSRLTSGLSRTSQQIGDTISSIFTKRKLDDEMLEALEETLILSDIGMTTTMDLVEKLRKTRFGKDVSPEDIQAFLAEEIGAILEPVARPIAFDVHKPHIVLVCGVNGTGKTTSIGKLAHYYRQQGKKVMLAAGDTFRAAAVEQLGVWGQRTSSRVITGKHGADAAGLAFDAIKAAQEDGTDLLLIDTAGRLQNKQGLMDELSKICRVIKKIDENMPHDTLLVLDATTGQNALSQVELFHKTTALTGLIVTKLDGTAKGGVTVALAQKFGLPLVAIGVGETAEDLQPFHAHEFAKALLASKSDTI